MRSEGSGRSTANLWRLTFVIDYFCVEEKEFANGFIAVGLALVPTALIIVLDKNFREHLGGLGKRLNALLRRVRGSGAHDEEQR